MLLFSAPSGRVSQEKKPKSKVVANAEAKAKRSLLNTVHTGLTNKALGALTDVSSKVLESTEPAMRATDDEIGAVVNAMNANVICSHLCVGKPKKRWAYIQRFASDKLTELFVRYTWPDLSACFVVWLRCPASQH
jgi:hypothetical protein